MFNGNALNFSRRTISGNRGRSSNRLFDRVTQRMTDQDMALLDAWRLSGRHGDERVDEALELAARCAGMYSGRM